jgi:hypothetical protein
MEVTKMRGHTQSGKIRFSTLIIMAILFYGGFCIVKIASIHVTKGQIKTSIINKIGEIRGPDLTVAKCEEIILDVLQENGILNTADETTTDESKTDNSTTDNSTTDNSTTDKTTEENTAVDDSDPQIKVTIGNHRAYVHFIVTYQYITRLYLFKYKNLYTVEGDIQNYN